MKRLVGSTGQYRTDSLFYERITKIQKDKGVEPIYTLFEYARTVNGKTYPSFYLEYMKCVDDYDAAMSILGSTEHLNKLKRIKWFTEGWKSCPAHKGYNKWVEDMFNRDASLAKKTLLVAAKEGNTSAANQLAALLKAQRMPTKGRPKAEDIAEAAAAKVDSDAAFEADIKRLNVVSIR